MAGRASKIHLALNSHGNPATFIITEDTTHDMKVAPDLIGKVDLIETIIVCAERGYDSEDLREHNKQTNIQSDIPSR